MTFKAIFLGLAILPAVSFANMNCTVYRVIDGDTIQCQDKTRVRLANIDAPESTQQYGNQATSTLKYLIQGRRVTIKGGKEDRYGRIVGTVWYNGNNVNKIMVEQGQAWVYREYLDDNSYLPIEAKAKAKRLGLWYNDNPIKPSDYRKQNKRNK